MLEPYLKSRGISWIDYAVVSHGDSDHINGLVYLLEESKDIRIGTLVLPVMGKGEEVYENLAVLARREGADVVYMKTADWVEAGELTLTCLYAGEDFGGKDRNSHSLVLCGDYKGFHMLFTGDMGEGQESSLVRLAEQEGNPAGYTFESCTDIENSPSWFQDIFIGGISGPIEDSTGRGFLWRGKFLWASVAGDNGPFQGAGDCGTGNRKKGSHNI